jgi:hypothetical protein
MRQKFILILLGIFFGLLICEILVTIFSEQNDSKPVYSFTERGLYANCYPSDSEKYFPLNLKIQADFDVFKKYFPNLYTDDPFLNREILDRTMGRERLDHALLSNEAPYCIIYNRSTVSDRRVFIPNESIQSSIALIGDSFAFGQGVKTKDTYGYQLANMTKQNVYNYSQFGANIMEILNQYNQAIEDHKKVKFKKLVYLYVLNDPLISNKMKSDQAYINDLMSYRPYNMALRYPGLSWILQPLLKLNIANFVINRFVQYYTAIETVKWYKNIYDANTNTDLHTTFEIINLMNEGSKKAKIDFYLVLYPIMTDMNHYPFDEIHTQINAMANDYGIKIIDTLPDFKNSESRQITVHPMDFHPNAQAHKIAARITAVGF